MARIEAKGIPVKYPEFGELRIYIYGNETDIKDAEFYSRSDGKLKRSAEAEEAFKRDVENGPSYPLCAEPFTMRSALFVLFEWFGEAESCWVEEPKHVKLEGEIEPMESVPGRIY